MTDERLIRVSGLKFPEPVGKGIPRLANGNLDKQKLLMGNLWIKCRL